MIKVLIVEDSPLISKILTKILESDHELQVVGVAQTGREGLRLATELSPDIITMDIVMPDMDGVEATKQIMAYKPTPILMLTSSHQRKKDEVFRAISFGALDVIEKTSFEQMLVEDNSKNNLIKKIKFLANIKVIKHPLAKLQQSLVSSDSIHLVAETKKSKRDLEFKGVIAIAASTGGPQALAAILNKLPVDFPWAILIVQHIARGFTHGLVEWLSKISAFKIKIAEDNEEITKCMAYVAPSGLHMRVAEGGIIRLGDDPPYRNFKPSADILFSSIAKVYNEQGIGIILTGMGRDGADGIGEIKKSGGRTIAQDEKTSVIFGMPKEAIERGAIDKVLSIDKIAEDLLK